MGVFHDINLALSFADTVLLMDHGAAYAYERAEQFDLSLVSEIYRMDVRNYMQNTLKRWE